MSSRERLLIVAPSLITTMPLSIKTEASGPTNRILSAFPISLFFFLIKNLAADANCDLLTSLNESAPNAHITINLTLSSDKSKLNMIKYVHTCMHVYIYDSDVATYVWYNIYSSVIFPWHENYSHHELYDIPWYKSLLVHPRNTGNS